MKVQIRYRSMVLAALGICLLAIAAFPQTAFAGETNNGKKGDAPGQQAAVNNGQAKKLDGAADQNQANATPSAGTPTAGDNPEGYSNHDQTNGPGGQICDGDPTNEPGAGGNYENTCDAGPSQNGAGDGQANGKPCAGCVGNADDKNPPGQATSGPTDHNNGYECDQKGRSANEGNNGVGYGNPAHTGCEATPTNQCIPSPANNQCQPPCTPTPANHHCDTDCVPSAANNQCQPCPSGQNMGANGCACPAGSTMGNNGKCETPCVPGNDVVCSQSTPSCVASAGNNRCGGGEVLGETLARPVEVLGVQLNAAPEAAVAPAALAFTGSSPFGLVRLASLLTLLGLGLVVLARRRRTVTAE